MAAVFLAPHTDNIQKQLGNQIIFSANLRSREKEREGGGGEIVG